ncbi:MAG TPA: glycosyltransferase family 39 protein [Aeromicrobium sp.]|nr:glycosyltransferase family 39 protein [Aeromicrobium sp.]
MLPPSAIVRRTIRSWWSLDVLLWAAVVWVVVFWRLGYLSLLDPDEAHYAQLTREMVRTRQWMVPLLEGVPFIDKPVLYHWLQAGTSWLFGETEFALRLPSAGAAIALIAMVRWTGRSLGPPAVGRSAALMFASTPLTFALASIGVFDMVFAAFLVGSVGCLLVAAVQRRKNVELAGWLLLVLAVMTKGPVAALLVVLFGLLLAAVPSTRSIVRSLHWFTGLALVALLSAPWFVYMASRYGDHFVRTYVLAGNLWYFTRPTAFSGRQSDTWFYARTFLGACFPWSVLALGVGVDALWSRRTLSIEERALWLWLLLIIGFFSLAGFKLDTYIFPAAPAACLLVALAWGRQVEPRLQPATRAAGWGVALVLLGGGLTLAVTMFRIELGLSAVAAILPAACIGGGMALAWALRESRAPRVTGLLVTTLLVVYGVVVVEGFPVLERSRPTAPIGRWVDRHASRDQPLGVYGLDDWRASIRFYSRRPLLVLHDGAEVAQFFERYPAGYAVMLRTDAARLRAAGVALHRVGSRRAIVGRSGKFIRKQRWGRIVVTAAGSGRMLAENDVEPDLPDN